MKIPNLFFRKITILALSLILTIFTISWLFSGSQTSAQSNDTNQPLSVLAATGTGFTYQGQLSQSGVPANGSFTFRFVLYDSAAGGVQIGSTQTKAITVSNGLFMTTLNEANEFGVTAFNGEARYLEIRVSDNGGTSYTTLTPRQSLTAAPYAHSLRPGAVINSAVNSGAILNLSNNGTNGVGLYVEQATNEGVTIGSANNGVYVASATTHGLVVGSAANGVYVQSASEDGIHVESATGDGVEVTSAVEGVHVVSASGAGQGSDGLQVDSATGAGVRVDAANTGLYVVSASNVGVTVGSAPTGVYVLGPVTDWAGYFTGNVNITGACTGCLVAIFGINNGDSPLEPGDVVALQGTRTGESVGQPLLMEVGSAQAGAPVVGVVYGRGELTNMEGLDGQQTAQLAPREGATQPGDYVHIIIYGPMQVKASAFGSAIQTGDKLAIDASGAARSLQTRELNGMTITESAPTIGMALEGLEASKDGLIWVLVNPQ